MGPKVRHVIVSTMRHTLTVPLVAQLGLSWCPLGYRGFSDIKDLNCTLKVCQNLSPIKFIA